MPDRMLDGIICRIQNSMQILERAYIALLLYLFICLLDNKCTGLHQEVHAIFAQRLVSEHTTAAQKHKIL